MKGNYLRSWEIPKIHCNLMEFSSVYGRDRFCENRTLSPINNLVFGLIGREKTLRPAAGTLTTLQSLGPHFKSYPFKFWALTHLSFKLWNSILIKLEFFTNFGVVLIHTLSRAISRNFFDNLTLTNFVDGGILNVLVAFSQLQLTKFRWRKRRS